MSQTKDVRRFWTPTIKKSIPRLTQLRIAKEIKSRKFTFQIKIIFSYYSQLWIRAFSIISELDAILSLAQASISFDGCKPIIYDSKSHPNATVSGEGGLDVAKTSVVDEDLNDLPMFEAKSLRHPCFGMMN